STLPALLIAFLRSPRFLDVSSTQRDHLRTSPAIMPATRLRTGQKRECLERHQTHQRAQHRVLPGDRLVVFRYHTSTCNELAQGTPPQRFLRGKIDNENTYIQKKPLAGA